MDRPDRISRRRILQTGGAALAAGLAGCAGGGGGGQTEGGGGGGGGGGGNGGGGNGGDKPESISYWDWGDRYQEPAKWFEEEHGVAVDYQQFPFGDYVSKVISAASAGDLPDVMNSSVLWVPRFADRDVAVPLEEHGFSPDDYVQAGKRNASFDGGLYAVPTYVDCRMMALNDDMFEQAGLEIPERTYVPTWEEFRSWAEELNKEFEYGASIDGGEGFDNFVLANGGHWVDDPLDPTEAVINEEEGVETAEYIKGLIDDDIVRMRLSNTDQGVVDDFRSETAPMAAFVGSWDLRTVNQSLDNWRYLPMPKGPSADSSHSWSAGNFLLATNQGNVDWAMEWLKFTESERLQQYLLETGGFPGVKKIYETDFFNTFLEENPNAVTIDQEIGNAKAFPSHPQAGDMYTLVHTQIESVWQGQGKPQAVLDGIAKEINGMLEG